MSLNFIDIINQIENEINIVYIPGAIKYCDDHFDNAWSKAIDTYEAAINRFIETKDEAAVNFAGEVYIACVKNLIQKYKVYKNNKHTDSLLDDLIKTPSKTNEVASGSITAPFKGLWD